MTSSDNLSRFLAFFTSVLFLEANLFSSFGTYAKDPGDSPGSLSTNVPPMNGPSFLFGVISDIGSNYPDMWSRGLRATTLEFHWRFYEPREGVYNQAYIDRMKQSLIALNAQGWFVQMIPGIQYIPEWVFINHPEFYFVNQYGESYTPDIPTRGDYQVINAPFNPAARDLIAGYIARIFQDFDQTDPRLQFDSVRIGGGPQGELRYPPPEWNGHHNSYWAFDSAAQNAAVSGIPAAVVGWRPGIDPNPGTTGRGQLIVNPGFEATHPFLQIPAWSPEDEITAELTSEEPHGGSQALKITILTPNRIHQYVRVSPNTTYQIGGSLRSGDGQGRARILLEQYDANNQPIPDAPFAKLETQSTLWADQNASLATSATTRYLKVEMDGDRPGIYYFDDLWLRMAGSANTQDRDLSVPIAFYDWYVASLTNYQNWQISEIRKHFAGQLDVVYAGKGVRNHQITDALANDLRGDGWSEASSALYSASAYERHVAGLIDTQGISLYVTGIEQPPAGFANDTTPYPNDWSAARWISFLGQKRGLPVWGENTGRNSPAEMRLSAMRILLSGLRGMMWAFESDLYANPNDQGFATIVDYETLIREFASIRYTFLPLTMIGP